MKELKEIIRDIREKLEDAEKYAKEAVKHKEQYKSLATPMLRSRRTTCGRRTCCTGTRRT